MIPICERVGFESLGANGSYCCVSSALLRRRGIMDIEIHLGTARDLKGLSSIPRDNHTTC